MGAQGGVWALRLLPAGERRWESSTLGWGILSLPPLGNRVGRGQEGPCRLEGSGLSSRESSTCIPDLLGIYCLRTNPRSGVFFGILGSGDVGGRQEVWSKVTVLERSPWSERLGRNILFPSLPHEIRLPGFLCHGGFLWVRDHGLEVIVEPPR